MNTKKIDRERLRQIDDIAEQSFGVRPFEFYPNRIRCPVCGKTYRPKYSKKEEAPEGSIGREQHMSGICSDECWDKMTLPGGRR
ncbi:MAG: hypothetical protein M1351_02150 [Candidatus Thermoplasmatota archaeon]|nr:hypothetical protein [Candidatus Thermoplasmatota archaeon]